MKGIWFIILPLLLSAALCSAGTPIGIFDFNSVPPDAMTSTGTNAPSLGSATISVIGGPNFGYVSGSSTDPATADDTALKTLDYPVITLGNKTAGIQVNASTIGFSNIVVRWDEEVSTTASKYWRFEYSTNGVTFTEWPTAIIMPADSKFFAFTNDLTLVPGVKENPHFAFRIVSEFENTATGGGLNGYQPVQITSHYDPTGTVRFDYIVISGVEIFDGNYPPTITSIGNQTVRVNRSTGPLEFQVLDAETPADALAVGASSSDPSVVPLSNIVFGGASQYRNVTITGGAQTGASVIKVWVADAGGKTNSTTFAVTVLPANTAPGISTIPATNTLSGTACGPLPFIVWDAESPSDSLVVTATSANPGLVPDSGITFSGSGSNRFVTVTPAPSATGVAPITIQVSDGTNTTISSFAVMVVPSPSILFNDSFDYANGSVVTNSGFLWLHRGGTDGDCSVSNGLLQVSADMSEDLNGQLIGAPYVVGNHSIIYCAFNAKFLNLPASSPDFFATFANGNSFRGRIYAFIPTNVDFGTFRLAVGNTTNSIEVPVNLHTNVIYNLVARYDVDAAATTLWINPASEQDPGGKTATDSADPATISFFSFRQSSSFDATVLVDDLKVGLSFEAVTAEASSPPGGILLGSRRDGEKLVLEWTNAAYLLQSGPSPAGPFTNIAGAASPYTNAPTGQARFYRLKAN